MRRHVWIGSVVLGVTLLILSGAPVFAQTGTATGAAGINASAVNPMTLQARVTVCGGLTQQGTPIAGNAAGGGNSGSIDIAGIPAGATVKRATLYWTVLTNDAEGSNTGASITFNGSGVTGTRMGTSDLTPCFPQENTIAWKADVTALVNAGGNGTYAVSGFPGGNAINGANFTEGVTLQVLWSHPAASLRDIVIYETPAGTGGLAVTDTTGDTLSQGLSGFQVNAAGPVSGTLYEVIGNGQDPAGETFSVTGSGGTVNLDNTLDGSTSEFAAETCSYTDSGLVSCFWDDDAPSIAGALNNASSSVMMNYTLTNDCHDWPAAAVAVSTDATGVCAAGGEYVDAQCPPGGTYANHGEYLKCVAHAAEVFLAGIACSPESFPYEETQSCIVNPRARSDVGMK